MSSKKGKGDDSKKGRRETQRKDARKEKGYPNANGLSTKILKRIWRKGSQETVDDEIPNTYTQVKYVLTSRSFRLSGKVKVTL